MADLQSQIKKFNHKYSKHPLVKRAVDYSPNTLSPFVLACGGVGAFLVFLMYTGLNPFINALVLYPTYRAYLGLVNNNVSEDAANLTCFMIFALVIVLEELFAFVKYIPLYAILKLIFFVWCFFFGGSYVFFRNVLMPFLQRHNSEIQTVVAAGKRFIVDEAEKTVADAVSSKIPLVLSHLSSMMSPPPTPVPTPTTSESKSPTSNTTPA